MFDKNKIQICHIRSYRDLAHGRVLDNNSGCTIAYTENVHQVYYSVAWCGPKDNFCRRTGRSVAVGRLLAGQSHVSLQLDLDSFYTALEKVKRLRCVGYNPGIVVELHNSKVLVPYPV